MTTFGVETFGDLYTDAPDEVIRSIVDDAMCAENVGIDTFGVGEHHRPDYAVTAPDVVLAGIATRTQRITLQPSAVILASAEPVRVVERYSTLQALSSGRTELHVGRGSSDESFLVCALEESDDDRLFDANLTALRDILTEDEPMNPPTATALPVWGGAGCDRRSVIPVAESGFDLVLSIHNGNPMYFKPFADLYHQTNEEHGHDKGRVAVHSPGLVAPTDAQARSRLFEPWMASQKTFGDERGWPAPSNGRFNIEWGHGSLYAGSPETVARKIVRTIRKLDADRFVLRYSTGTVAPEHMRESIQLYGEQVIPMVKEMLGE